MPRAPKKCARDGCETRIVGRTYCPPHTPDRPSPTLTQRTKAERKRRARTVSAWVASHGWWCPGYERPGHPSHDLTAAHSIAVARGGISGPLTVLCRACNSRQGVSPTPPLHPLPPGV